MPVAIISVPAAIYTRHLLDAIRQQHLRFPTVVLKNIQVFWDVIVRIHCNIPPYLNLEVRSAITEIN